MPSKIIIRDGFAFIQMTQGFEALIDIESIPLVSHLNWWPKKDKLTTYARSKENYKSKTIYLHKLILSSAENSVIDHKNGDGLDNRIANLRAATHQQNMHNSRTPCNNSSGFKGVHFHKRSGKWMSRISINGSHVYLGLFSDINEASFAYEMASKRLHGDFGRFI